MLSCRNKPPLLDMAVTRETVSLIPPGVPWALAFPSGQDEGARAGSCLRRALQQPHQQRLIEGKPSSR